MALLTRAHRQSLLVGQAWLAGTLQTLGRHFHRYQIVSATSDECKKNELKDLRYNPKIDEQYF